MPTLTAPALTPAAAVPAPTDAEQRALHALRAKQYSPMATNIIPADMLRHSLFAGNNYAAGARPRHKNKVIFRAGWIDVTVDGEQLGQREADIYAALLAHAAMEGSYVVTVTRAVLFERLGLTHGGHTVERFDEDLKRLQDTKITLKVETKAGRRYSCRGALIGLCERLERADGKLEALRIHLNSVFSPAFEGGKLFPCVAERKALRGDALAGWLHSFFQANYLQHAKVLSFPLADLRRLSGHADTRTDKFNAALTAAVEKLKPLGYNVALPQAGQSKRIDAKGIVTITPTAVVAHPEPASAKPKRRAREVTAAEVGRLQQAANAASEKSERITKQLNRTRAQLLELVGARAAD